MLTLVQIFMECAHELYVDLCFYSLWWSGFTFTREEKFKPQRIESAAFAPCLGGDCGLAMR